MPQSNIQIIFKFFAKNPPSIAIAGGILLILLGGMIDNPQMMDYGWAAIIIGALLQAGWLLMTFASKRKW